MKTMRLSFKALFGSWFNSLVTAVMLALLAWIVPQLWSWALSGATWIAQSKTGCAAGGACWAFVGAKLKLFLYGNYPAEQEWRVHLALAVVVASLAGCVLDERRKGRWLLMLMASVPVGAVLLAGGILGLVPVRTSEWGGLMLNLVLAFVAVLVSIPAGIALAFARLSKSRTISWAATVFIEFWRAVPLLAVLFMGVVMLPLFLPKGVSVDNLMRAMIVLVLFTSAYMAEVFRGALQDIPTGQTEAAAALGLRKPQVALLILLPQAMRIAVPGIVNIMVDLFKDTSLVSIVGLFDLTGVAAQSVKDPAWLGLSTEAYVFAAMLFFVWCLLMSLSGQLMERRLNSRFSGR
ncbi:amino acid ABC transporter membrane protein 2, PAAT family [Bosea sp. OK403]|uniref:amino acid ABC transporter permease n=1 Tax=Bosea sp. OK403 TaxID=1855286 RepID=UPI0008DFF945|nr:amino acid ABC transporter permease [Bosea sp. OK403]SFI04356.1 amino acid ABC transporter membrane protein 2, PAAT family [Bosea sp. OK403]